MNSSMFDMIQAAKLYPCFSMFQPCFIVFGTRKCPVSSTMTNPADPAMCSSPGLVADCRSGHIVRLLLDAKFVELWSCCGCCGCWMLVDVIVIECY